MRLRIAEQRRLLSRESLAAGREFFWENVPDCIERTEPETWINPSRHAEWHQSAPEAEAGCAPLDVSVYWIVFKSQLT